MPRILTFNNQLDRLTLTRKLDETAIPYEIIDRFDTASPNVTNPSEYQVVINTSNYEQITELTGVNYRFKDIKVTQRPPRNYSYLIWLLIGYALIVTLLLAKYYNINQQNTASKNYRYNWNVNNTYVATSLKKDNQLINRSYDRNYDLNYERIEGISQGKVILISFDEDENGLYERSEFYDSKGKLSGIQEDSDEDGFAERGTIHLSDGRTIIFADQNGDGAYDVVRGW